MPDALTFLLCSYCLIYFNHPICQSHWLFLMLLFTISISNSFICHGIVLFPNVEGKFFVYFSYSVKYMSLSCELICLQIFCKMKEVGSPLHLPTSLIVNFSKIEDHFPPLYCVAKLGTGNFCFFMSAPFSLYFFITL